MPAMHAYLDDFGKITIWMNKNFYGGRSDYFSLVEGSSSQDLVVVNAEEHDTKMKYVLTCPADGTFGKDYKIRESHGLMVPLQIRNIVSTDEFNRMFYYGGDDLGSIYHATHTDFALWAPTAVSVTLHIHMNKKVDSYPMKRSDHGVWRMRVEGDLSHALYCYFVERNGCVVRSLYRYALSIN